MPPVPSRTPSDTLTIQAGNISIKDGGKTPSVPVSYKHCKLISVTFKEASLDSPSFRASMNHLDLQLLNTEKWLTALTASLIKVPREVMELRSFLNSFLEYLVPLFLEDGLLDQEYTVASLNNTKDGLKMIWSLALSIIEVNMPNIEHVRDEIFERIAAYKQLRKRFDAAQSKYDKFLSLFMALSKLKDAVMIMEDLLQVFAVRKEYIQLCLDLTMEISEVSNLVNERLRLLNFSLWSERMERFSLNPVILAMFSEFWTKTKRIRCWSDNYHKAMLNLSGDLLVAKKHIEERTVSQVTPSNVLNDYRALLINSRVLGDTTESSAEIHGYLFMKTWVEKSNKPIWVKRWAFIQGGVFGFLVLSPSQSSVQETDKIGVLLCNAKYSPNEDRRLCFEVKTIDTTLILQAETLNDLKSWLKVFENARNRIINENDPMHDLFNIASGRYPPLVTEFLSAVNTVVDKEITSSRIINNAGQIITSSRLSSHLEKNEKMFQNVIYNKIARIYLPFVTDTSRSSLIAYSLTGSTAVPTALSANIWGSLNWGVYYMNDSDKYEEVYDDIPEEPFTRQIGNGIKVPRNFPNLWLPRDTQLRSLFEVAVGPLECCLVSFNCLLSPNANQELRGTLFFTQKRLYSYIHSLGFVSLGRASITHLVEAQCTPKKNYDLLKVVNVQGSLKTKLYLDDGVLVAKKLNCIFRNAASDKPVGVSSLITRILEIENEHNAELEKAKKRFFNDEDPRIAITNPSSFDFMVPSGDPKATKLYQVDFSDEMACLGEHIVKLPPQALLHILFGARSSLLEESYPVVRVKLSNHTKWRKDPKTGGISRNFVTDFRYYGTKSGRIVVQQEMETMAENEYYNCKITRSRFKMKHGPEFMFTARMVLIGIEGGRTRLKYYSAMNTVQKSPFSWMIRQVGRSYTQSFFGQICRKIDEATTTIGHSGKIMKAIYMYGKIEVTDIPYEVPVLPPSEISLGTVIRLFYMGIMTSVTRRFLASVYFLLSVSRVVLLSLSMHRTLVGIIALLGILNIYLSAITTQYYWNSREAGGLVRDVLNYEPMMMERAIYVKEIQEILRGKEVFVSDSKCFRTFENSSFVLNFGTPAAWNNEYKDELTREAALKLRRSLQDIGIRRNELLVNLRMLNALEEEIARGEWKNWLVSELEKCDHLKHLQLMERVDVYDEEFEAALESINDYCLSCAGEMDRLIAQGLHRQ